MLSIIERPVTCSGGVELLTVSDAADRPLFELDWHQFEDHWDMHVEVCADPSVHWIVNFVRVDDSVVVGTRPPAACESLLTRLNESGDLDRWEAHWPMLRTLQYGDFDSGFLANFQLASGRVPWFIVSGQLTDFFGRDLAHLQLALRTQATRALKLGLAFLEELPMAYAKAVVADPKFDHQPTRLERTFEGTQSVIEILHTASDLMKLLAH